MLESPCLEGEGHGSRLKIGLRKWGNGLEIEQVSLTLKWYLQTHVLFNLAFECETGAVKKSRTETVCFLRLVGKYNFNHGTEQCAKIGAKLPEITSSLLQRAVQTKKVIFLIISSLSNSLIVCWLIPCKQLTFFSTKFITHCSKPRGGGLNGTSFLQLSIRQFCMGVSRLCLTNSFFNSLRGKSFGLGQLTNPAREDLSGGHPEQTLVTTSRTGEMVSRTTGLETK